MDTPRLHPDTIEQVKQRVDIVDVVSEHVVLRKRGKDFVGLCPFHDDKSPSFSVSPGKQFYYCFSCGAGGNAIKFLMELGKRSFSDVILDLARRYNVSVQTLEPEQRQELQRQLSRREQLYEILTVTAKFYEHALRQPQGYDALTYLQATRQLQDEMIQHFQFGFAPPGWDTLYGYLVNQKHYPVELVEQAGLIVPRKGNDGYYDRFRNRLMIPIHDLQSRVVGFAGRTLGDEQPKYLNSPETELFDKGQLLFALDKARAEIAKQDQAIVVEGYFDVVALHAAGITHAVASMGTALSLQQVRQLLRYTESKRIVLNFDADSAGTKAANRAIGEVEDLAYRGEVQLRVLNIPDGKDPDDYLQTHTADDYQALLNGAPLWIDWQLQQILVDQDLSQADQFQRSVQAIVQLLGKLPNAPLRTHYIHHCAELLSQGEARLTLQLESDLRIQVRGQRWHGQGHKWEKPGDYTLREAAEAQLLSIYLHCPNYRPSVLDVLKSRDLEFSLSHHRFLWRQILDLQEPLIPTDDIPLIEQVQDPNIVSTLTELDVLGALQDRYTDFPNEMAQVSHILQLNEKTRLDICRPALDIRVAAACLEQIMCEKRCRHFLKIWSDQTLKSLKFCLEQLLEEVADAIAPDSEDMEELIQALYADLNTQALQFHQFFYEENRYLQQLQAQRCVSSTELLQTPLVDYLVA
jgi:DNA primase